MRSPRRSRLVVAASLLLGALMAVAPPAHAVIDAIAQWLQPSWSPDGLVVFASDLGAPQQYQYKIFAMTTWASLFQVTTPADNPFGTDQSPAVSPDGTTIAFARSGSGIDGLYVMSIEGAGQTNLTADLPGLSDQPAWSRDGTQIAFTHGLSVWVMNADGSGKRRLTSLAGAEFFPTWSPDGTQIALTAEYDEPGNLDVYVVDVGGSGVARLTDTPGEDQMPAWSPDGATIAFVSDRDHNREIYTMHADGSAQTNISQDLSSTEERPAWSADGRRIVFSSTRDDVFSNSWEYLYTMRSDGSEQTRIVNPVRLLAGRKLVLSGNPGKPAARKMVLQSRDPSIAFLGSSHSPEDPDDTGASLRVSGRGFGATYLLPKSGWSSLGVDLGFRYRAAKGSNDPVQTVTLRPGLLKVTAKGTGLAIYLALNPEPVSIVFTTGVRAYCLSFTDTTAFRPGKLFKSKNASPPPVCP